MNKERERNTEETFIHSWRQTLLYQSRQASYQLLLISLIWHCNSYSVVRDVVTEHRLCEQYRYPKHAILNYCLLSE